MYKNPCSRCGTERVISKRWEEQMYDYPGATKVIHVEKVCPDPSCQKEVDKELKAQQKKKDNLKLRSQQRLLERKARKDAERLAAMAK